MAEDSKPNPTRDFLRQMKPAKLFFWFVLICGGIFVTELSEGFDPADTIADKVWAVLWLCVCPGFLFMGCGISLRSKPHFPALTKTALVLGVIAVLTPLVGLILIHYVFKGTGLSDNDIRNLAHYLLAAAFLMLIPPAVLGFRDYLEFHGYGDAGKSRADILKNAFGGDLDPRRMSAVVPMFVFAMIWAITFGLSRYLDSQRVIRIGVGLLILSMCICGMAWSWKRNQFKYFDLPWFGRASREEKPLLYWPCLCFEVTVIAVPMGLGLYAVASGITNDPRLP